MVLEELGGHVVCGDQSKEFDCVFFKIWILEWTHNNGFGIIINSQNGVFDNTESRFLDGTIRFELDLSLN